MEGIAIQDFLLKSELNRGLVGFLVTLVQQSKAEEQFIMYITPCANLAYDYWPYGRLGRFGSTGSFPLSERQHQSDPRDDQN